MHLFFVTLMAFAETPSVLFYPSLLWGVCSFLAIPLCEEQFDLILPSIWKYRHLVGLGIVYTILL